MAASIHPSRPTGQTKGNPAMTIRVVLALLCAVFWATAADAQGFQRVLGCGQGEPPPGLSPGSQDANGNGCVTPGAGTPIANSFTQLTPTVATGLSPPAGATWVLITVEGQPVRWCDDGTVPTSTVGQLAPVGTSMFYKINTLAAIQFIQVAPSATIDVSFYQ